VITAWGKDEDWVKEYNEKLAKISFISDDFSELIFALTI
jgi:hypothetical protein